MIAQLTVVCGPPRSGKTERLLARYRSALAENSPGATLWLAPAWRAAAEIRGRLLGGTVEACFSPAVMTFENFAETVLQAIPEAIRPISRLAKRQLVRRLIAEQGAHGRLKHFRPITGTAGLVDLVCDFISELKRLEIWPEHFQQACAARGLGQKDVELCELYAAYQQCLRENQLYDAEGSFWSARDSLGKSEGRGARGEGRAAEGGSWRRLRLVVVDGFTDFTRTQHEILEILAARVEEMLISLPLEPEPRRHDLFSKPLTTLATLRSWHGDVRVEELSRPAQPRWPAMAHLEQTLFASPRRARPAAETTGIEILAAARQIGEIELIGRRIKRLLAEGAAAPGDIAVVFRAPQLVGSLLGEAFGGLGIPFSLECGEALDRAPAIRALLALLQLDDEDWPWRKLLAVLGNNYFQPEWPEWRQHQTPLIVAKVVRRLQIPRGRERLIEQLTRAAEGASRTAQSGGETDLPPTEDEEAYFDDGDKRPRAHARLALAALGRLAAAFDALPQEATLADWGKAWQGLARQTGLLRTIEQDASSAPWLRSLPSAPCASVWDRVEAVLGECDRLDRWLSRQPAKLDRQEALAALLDVVASEQMKSAGDESGCVRVLSAASARALQVPYLFLAGLAEKAFPPPDREDRLYNEAEYERLIDEGLPLVARHQRSRDEMLLFYEVMTRATRQLFLSYPALDESGQPLSPSPYLKEVENACGAGRIARTELIDLNPVPTDAEPLSPAEFRVKAVADAIRGDVALLAGLIQRDAAIAAWSGMVENLLAGLQLTHLRQDRERFGPAEGMLLGSAAQARLADVYGPHHVFSATELEQYASCPYRFSLERILKIAPVEDLTVQVDFLERGRLAHRVLAELHRRVNQSWGGPASPLELAPQDYERVLAETLAEALSPDSADPVREALREVDRRVLMRWIADYRRQHECYDALWQDCDRPLRPELFEVSFGRPLRGDDPHSVAEPLELIAEERTILISGRIDRIDTGLVAGHCVCNVLDYKTGGTVRFSREAVAAGTALQLPLYAMAAAELLLADRDSIPWQAGYWYFRDQGFKPKQSLKMYARDDDDVAVEPEWEEIRGGLADTVAALVRGMARGEFAVCNADTHCTGICPYRTVCRVSQVRAMEKTFKAGIGD